VIGPRYRKDLYRGAAEHYERFRLGYPPILLDDLCARSGVGAMSRVLDLACGTGQITFALAGHVREAVAVDQEPEMVELGERKAQRLGVANTRWMAAAAEEVERDPHEQVLRRAGLAYDGKFEFTVPGTWSIDSLVGLVYSTSFLNPTALGSHAEAFEADLRAGLQACRPDGVFAQTLSFAYELARRAG
jgi:SAM-dependent methyltransferase